jgi:diguanylate cyclase (GGDEF)-like protein
MFLFIAVAALLFAGLADRLLTAQARASLAEQARLCAAALAPSANGNLYESVDRLQRSFDGLVAVATLNGYGNVQHVYPDRPSYRIAIHAAHATPGDVRTIPSPYDGQPLCVGGIVVSLKADPSFSARKVFVLLKAPDPPVGFLRAIGHFAGALFLLSLLVVSSQRRWFDRRIAHPLRRLTNSISERRRRRSVIPPLEGGEWVETAEFADRCHSLLQDLADSAARAERIEQESENELRRRQSGFDRLLRRAKDEATIDPLTRLRNRSFLEEELERIFGRAKLGKDDLTAMMIDVDNFKQYNDGQGHQSGDGLLRFVGALLRGGIRPTDHAIRYGGDEFLILLPETGVDEAALIGERLVKLFGQYLICLGSNHNLSISVGVASLHEDRATSGHQLVAMADTALYAAKRGGKNTVSRHRAA